MISAIVHTFNEENNIDRCLSSLSWADEIILVDMGSTDGTRAKAANFKVKIFPHPYTGFVEPARNFGIKKAQGEWIIILDADEEIPRSLAEQLKKSAKEDLFDFCRISRKNITFGKWIKYSGWWPDYQIRFFKKGTVSWTEKIHSIPLTYGRGYDLEATEALSIVHHNYQTVSQFIERLNRYTNISAKELFLDNQHFSFPDLFRKPAKEFVNRYFVWEGYKDGVHGLALSFLQSFSELISYLKLWELENFQQEKTDLNEIKQSIAWEYRLKNFWLTNTLLEKQRNFLTRVGLKIKRKLNCL